MSIRTLKATCVLAVSLAVILVPASSLVAEQSVQKECPLGAGGEVEVTTLSGTVRVMAGAAGAVLVTGTLGDDVEELEIDCSSGRVSVELRLPQGSKKNVQADAHLEITVPADAAVAVSTVSADISSKDLGGELEFESVSGKLDIEGDARSVDAASVSGDVHFKGRSSDVEVESVSGNVVVDEAHGRLEASSVSGSVRILGGTLEAGSVESVSGNVSSAAAVAASGRLEIESHSGSVKVQIPSGTGASIHVSSFSGSIVNDLGAERPESGGYGTGKTLDVEVGGGGGTIEIESFSGTVHLGSS